MAIERDISICTTQEGTEVVQQHTQSIIIGYGIMCYNYMQVIDIADIQLMSLKNQLKRILKSHNQAQKVLVCYTHMHGGE